MSVLPLEANFDVTPGTNYIVEILSAVVVILLVAWIGAVVGAITYGRDFEAARVNQVLMWVLLLTFPLGGTIFFYVVRPRLKRGRAENVANV